MADISKVQLPDGTSYDIKDKTSGYITGMTILSYGSSTWQDFIDAYNANRVVYCRASSNSNPASGSQTRLAFMAYVNNATTPTNVESQYYRSIATHSDSQQGDQVFVYKLDKTAGWSVTTREAATKIAIGGDLTKSYSSGTLTISGTFPTVPTNVSDFTNDAGYLTSSTGVTTFNGNSGAITFSETDPTVPSWAKENSKPSYTASEVGAVATSAVGAASGVAPLNSSSKIDEAYLPSYVDDVIEGYYYNNKFWKESSHTTEIPGESGKIYVDLTTNKTYRWSGSTFVEISSGGTATDVQINGTSITSGGVANIPYASDSSVGVVNTTEQKIAGHKIFSLGAISIDNEENTSLYPRFYFRDTAHKASSSSTMGFASAQLINNNTDITQNRFSIALASPKSDGTGYTTKTENYLLPTVTNGLTDNVTYNILTTKDYADYVVTKSTQQNIPGLKWFSAGAVIVGNYEIKDTYNYSEFDFRDQTFTTSIETSSGTRSAYIINGRDTVGSSLGNKMNFVIRSPKADGTGYASGHDIYKLPAPANGQTSNPEYDILTTKNTKTATATLSSGSWSNSTQSVTVTGMTSSTIVIVSPAPASVVAYRNSGIYCSAQATNSLTFTCTTTPTSNITVQVLTIG